VKFLADENIDYQIVEHLRQEDHSVLYVAELNPGISDTEVLGLANKENAILITSDSDFGELVFRQRRLTSGVIYIRLGNLSSEQKANIIVSAINQHGEEFLNSFVVISSNSIRIRKSIVRTVF
jgi:predicted nuclease of predicted toxin-antitoxin system